MLPVMSKRAASWAHRITLLALIITTRSHSLRLSPPSSAPDDASAVLDPAFVSFAIEGRDFIDYTGTSTAPNAFSLNMFATFSKTIGVPFYLRVGGTTQDHFHYDPAQAEAIRYEHPNQPTLTNLFAPITIGRTWLEGLAQVPNVLWDMQIPLARKNLSNAVLFAGDCVEAIGVDKLHTLELGNEPDLYGSSGFANATDRPAGYGVADYVAEVDEYVDAISGNVSLPHGPVFQALGFSNFVEDPWNEENAFAARLSGETVKTVTEHYYQTEDGQDLETTLMSPAMTRNLTSLRFSDRIAYMHTHHPSIPFLIAEAASALGNGSGIRDFELTASLGTALWTIDWLLYCATLGVTRINLQLGTRFPFSPWLPVQTDINNVTRPAQPLASFYGALFVAEMLAGGEAQVLELDTGAADVVAYASYHGAALSSVAVVDFTTGWEEGARPNSTVILTGLDAAKVRVERLTGPRAEAEAEEVAWKGERWGAEGVPVRVGEGAEGVEVVDGEVVVEVRAVEGVLVRVVEEE